MAATALVVLSIQIASSPMAIAETVKTPPKSLGSLLNQPPVRQLPKQTLPKQHDKVNADTQAPAVRDLEPVSVTAPPPPPPPAPVAGAPTEPAAPADPSGAQAFAASQLGVYGWGSDQMGCLIELWNRESGWRSNADNSSSGAYGIPQALPGSKMATAGADWETNPDTQITWGLRYIQGSYGSPCGAWAHETSAGWY